MISFLVTDSQFSTKSNAIAYYMEGVAQRGPKVRYRLHFQTINKSY